MSTQPAPAAAARTHLVDLAVLGDLDELADVLVVLEDFLLHADADILEELAGYRTGRPADPHAWATWVTARLGEHAAAARTHPVDLAVLGDLDELADVLVVLEDFLLHADADILEELAGYRPSRPADPHAWAAWVTARIGEHAAALRALTTAETPPPTPIGAPR